MWNNISLIPLRFSNSWGRILQYCASGQKQNKGSLIAGKLKINIKV